MMVFDGDSIVALDGSYDLGNGFRALGSYANFDGVVTQLAVGGGYEISEDMWIDLSLGRISEDDFDVDLIGLEISYEMGRETLLIDRSDTVQAEAFGVLGQILQ